MISERGSLKETSTIKLLIAVFEYDLTGILYLKQDDILKVLYLNRGKLIWAISNSTEDKLENILLAEGAIDSNAIIKVRDELNTPESIGKVLVEKGIITLEKLIDSTKKQLARIVLSVLKWEYGGFQFVKGTSPERPLSLDLNIIDFIINYILEDLDVSYIWKEIGSLQIELVKNPDPVKVSKFNLTDNQRKLLTGFDGEKKLEEVLSSFGGTNRDSQLKEIYFFLIAEILVKKEFDLSNSPFMKADRLSEEAKERISTDEAEVEDVKPKPGEEHVFSHEPEECSILPDSAPEAEAEDVKSEVNLLSEEKKKVHLFNYFFLFIIVIFIMGGIIFLMLSPDDKPENVLNKEKEDQVIEVVTSNERDEINNAVDSLEIQMEKKQDTELDQEKSKQAQILNKELPKDRIEVIKPTLAEKKETLAVGKSALQYFKEGNLIVAADIWRKEILDNKVKYSVLLELDCEKKSVQRAFSEVVNKENFFILLKKRRNKSCYLVLWGRYLSRQQAKSDLTIVPDFFWRQSHPPVVFELKNI